MPRRRHSVLVVPTDPPLDNSRAVHRSIQHSVPWWSLLAGRQQTGIRPTADGNADLSWNAFHLPTLTNTTLPRISRASADMSSHLADYTERPASGGLEVPEPSDVIEKQSACSGPNSPSTHFNTLPASPQPGSSDAPSCRFGAFGRRARHAGCHLLPHGEMVRARWHGRSDACMHVRTTPIARSPPVGWETRTRTGGKSVCRTRTERRKPEGLKEGGPRQGRAIAGPPSGPPRDSDWTRQREST
jgi:hypothetical protein